MIIDIIKVREQNGKQIKKHRRRVKRNLEEKTEESEDKKPKLAES